MVRYYGASLSYYEAHNELHYEAVIHSWLHSADYEGKPLHNERHKML